MTEKIHHGNKWMPVMYAMFYGILIDVARDHGYALCVHGSMTRDFDLVAVPWVDDPKPHEEMLEAMGKALGVIRVDDKAYNSTEQKPHGRIGYTMLTGGGGYIDISIIPTLTRKG